MKLITTIKKHCHLIAAMTLIAILYLCVYRSFQNLELATAMAISFAGSMLTMFFIAVLFVKSEE